MSYAYKVTLMIFHCMLHFIIVSSFKPAFRLPVSPLDCICSIKVGVGCMIYASFTYEE